ncbi:hypothetical protein EYZ11_004685 [Aspergillus tanneri]|uniref:Glutamine amidotransferase domain-containing protein n=1 Tax=Aspergillus tanneri TaxID=1220188 RepID=A0A4S3JMA2_9EURO|nr:uncharacterized protein ATNIH1004_008398 [Aspergillus tanneri]KAA8644199.1 hypothetical protein ATNIH1004_008398 [Aspergillus tanneri]THC95858.1 hypothetical protein EYZ11_004685 [Aspergillus tanneri]
MIHIAILDCDLPVPAVYPTRGLYSSQFRTLLQSAAARLPRNIAIHTTAFDVVGGCLPPLASLRTDPRSENEPPSPSNPLAQPIDAILITGAAAGAYETDTHAWIIPLTSYLRTVYRDFPHVRFFGSCFGHQILAQTLLSSSLKNEPCPHGREMGLVPVSLEERFLASFPSVATLLPDRNLRLQMIHGDWVVPVSRDTNNVVELPEPWMNIGSTAQCPVQGLFCPGRVLTFQGHFEFDVFVNGETCQEFARRMGWDKDRVREWLGLIERGQDGDDAKVAAEIVVMFFADV